MKTKAVLLKMKKTPLKTKATLMKMKLKTTAAALALSFLTLALAVGATGGTSHSVQTSQSPWMTLPTLPVREKGFPARLAPVVEAEHAFAQYSIDHGMKDAFLSYAAPDGVIVQREPVNAIETWARR